MKIVATIALVAAGFGLGAAYPAFVSAQADDHSLLHEHLKQLFHGQQEGHLEQHVTMLGLDEQQKTQVAKVLAANLDPVQSRIEAWIGAREGQCQTIHAGQYNEAAIRPACQAAAAAEEELVVTLTKVANELWAILTPKQRDMMKHHHPDVFSMMKNHVPLARARIQEWIKANGG